MTDLDRVRALFDQALERPRAERREFVQRESGLDDDLASQVLDILRQHEESESIGAGPSNPFAAALPAGTVVGRYRIASVIGEGGMGTVYQARQQKPDREVALKLVRPGYASRTMLRRFELEAEVLGRLQHPGIAQIYEAGTAEVGSGSQPFFAMELVTGLPLTQYAQEHKLGTRQLLELMATLVARGLGLRRPIP